VATARAAESYSVYPNLLAVGWLVPMVLAAGFAAHEPDADQKRTLVSLALGSLLLSEVHPLYWAIACIALAPLFALRAIAALRARRLARGFFGACLLALLAGAPLALIARYGGQPSEQQVRAAQAHAVRLPAPPSEAHAALPKPEKPHRSALETSGGHLEKQLEHGQDGERRLSVASAGGWTFLLLGLAALVPCLLWPEPLCPRMVALAVAATTLAAIPLVPSLATFVTARLLPDFGVARMITLASSLFFVALANAVAAFVDRYAALAAVRHGAVVLVVIGASQLPGHAPRSFREHVQNACGNEAKRHTLLDEHRARRGLLRAHIAAGETVLTTLREARYVVMLHDLHVVAADRGHGHVAGIALRRAQVELMTQPQTAWATRELLLRHYGLRF
jgi:hypothetical protein